MVWVCTEARDGDDPAFVSASIRNRMSSVNGLKFGICFANENLKRPTALLIAEPKNLAEDRLE